VIITHFRLHFYLVQSAVFNFELRNGANGNWCERS